MKPFSVWNLCHEYIHEYLGWRAHVQASLWGGNTLTSFTRGPELCFYHAQCLGVLPHWRSQSSRLGKASAWKGRSVGGAPRHQHPEPGGTWAANRGKHEVWKPVKKASSDSQPFTGWTWTQRCSLLAKCLQCSFINSSVICLFLCLSYNLRKNGTWNWIAQTDTERSVGENNCPFLLTWCHFILLGIYIWAHFLDQVLHKLSVLLAGQLAELWP